MPFIAKQKQKKRKETPPLYASSVPFTTRRLSLLYLSWPWRFPWHFCESQWAVPWHASCQFGFVWHFLVIRFGLCVLGRKAAEVIRVVTYKLRPSGCVPPCELGTSAQPAPGGVNFHRLIKAELARCLHCKVTFCPSVIGVLWGDGWIDDW